MVEELVFEDGSFCICDEYILIFLFVPTLIPSIFVTSLLRLSLCMTLPPWVSALLLNGTSNDAIRTVVRISLRYFLLIFHYIAEHVSFYENNHNPQVFALVRVRVYVCIYFTRCAEVRRVR